MDSTEPVDASPLHEDAASAPTELDCVGNLQEVGLLLREPISERGVALKKATSPERWAAVVKEAWRRLSVLEAVRKHHRDTGESMRASVRAVASDLKWSTFLGWRRRFGTRPGPAWERLLDGRIPPPQAPVLLEVRNSVVLLRRVVPGMPCVAAREHLVKQFGEDGDLSDACLRRIWRPAGLTSPAYGDPSRFEKVEIARGGGCLGWLGAAASESGVFLALAKAMQESGREIAAAQPPPTDRGLDIYRDDHGRFTAAYNEEGWRGGVAEGVADDRWKSDRTKTQSVNLSELSVLALRPETLADRLLGIALVPFISDRRGYDGLNAPRGRWLKVAGIHDYHPPTAEKTVAELGLLGVDQAAWRAHGRVWSAKAREWSSGGPSWLQFVHYVDITTDPHYTHQYALSGKVSRVGRVMPCLSRVTVTSGAGFPMLMDTGVGTRSLKALLLGALILTNHLDGAGNPLHFTVVDAEAATAGLLTVLNDIPGQVVITVLKGNAAKGKTLQDAGDWQPYRERDQIRPGWVRLYGEGAPKDGLLLYAVEMKRNDSRHPHPTTFITTGSPETLAPETVADMYLSRWPNQEMVFRNLRNGAGLEHSHGYGGGEVTHGTLIPKIEDATKAESKCRKSLEDATSRLCTLKSMEKKADPDSKIEIHEVVKQAAKEVKSADKAVKKAEERRKNLETTPKTIFKRDTTRENIVTACTLSLMMLLEWVLREYFDGQRMEMRTFIEYFTFMPTEIRTSAYRITYRLETNDLPTDRAEMVRRACDRVTQRKVRRDGRLLVFEAVDNLAHFQGPGS